MNKEIEELIAVHNELLNVLLADLQEIRKMNEKTLEVLKKLV